MKRAHARKGEHGDGAVALLRARRAGHGGQGSGDGPIGLILIKNGIQANVAGTFKRE
jgi:hypothetical protein